jgi:hypothetical protein
MQHIAQIWLEVEFSPRYKLTVHHIGQVIDIKTRQVLGLALRSLTEIYGSSYSVNLRDWLAVSKVGSGIDYIFFENYSGNNKSFVESISALKPYIEKQVIQERPIPSRFGGKPFLSRYYVIKDDILGGNTKWLEEELEHGK